MISLTKTKSALLSSGSKIDKTQLQRLIDQSYDLISPYWPLKNLVATQPLQGFESLPFELALEQSEAYFQAWTLPPIMDNINIETIKWLQVYCDEGQATFQMPLKEKGLYLAWQQLAPLDLRLYGRDKHKKIKLKNLSADPYQTIHEVLIELGLQEKEYGIFLTLTLTTLPGWASYTKYCIEKGKLKKEDYFAMRLMIILLIWPEAKNLLAWTHHPCPTPKKVAQLLDEIESNERRYASDLLDKLRNHSPNPPVIPKAQFIFCIDVRSEPLRYALEKVDNYETFGVAGFFGAPISLKNQLTGEVSSSCPVILTPTHEVTTVPYPGKKIQNALRGNKRKQVIIKLYQSLKYNLVTPFALVESTGLIIGLLIVLKTFFPRLTQRIRSLIEKRFFYTEASSPCIDSLALSDQITFAKNLLSAIGLTQNFSSLVVLCGHGSESQNNAYASALNCGACGARPGGDNAKLMALVLNRAEVRTELAKENIHIPQETLFIGAQHNTTTDEMELYISENNMLFDKLRHDLHQAKAIKDRLNSDKGVRGRVKKAFEFPSVRANDWAQTRPEWGLANNASLIIGPRTLTASTHLEGRAFLHSYNAHQDVEGKILTQILKGPLIVAYWINMQYLFSTWNNTAYGSGSKITHNITGKIGVMQGNLSDLMTGLPLQSLYLNDKCPYHKLQRLVTLIYAPLNRLQSILNSEPNLAKLARNGWVKFILIEPNTQDIYCLNRGMQWEKA